MCTQPFGTECNTGTQQRDDSGMSNTEIETNQQWLLTIRNEFSRDIVNRRNVICVYGVTQTKGKGKNARGRKFRVGGGDQREWKKKKYVDDDENGKDDEDSTG